MCELKAILDQTRRRSAPGADRITFRMLCNLADTDKERLRECFNTIWDTGVLSESWLVAVVTPVLKSRKPTIAISSYGPVSLTSTACKTMVKGGTGTPRGDYGPTPVLPGAADGLLAVRCSVPCSLLHLCRPHGTLDPGAEEVHAIH
ncbi:hypothetical protein HPB49_016691 [Dermacentor silvarum]|uniref:Uncharacterized protein n=1 Tax=Dermacentor silvarum TaxID=543639 RepID=A0ACB8E1J0_DERSI|nr:hypothetical protein HPB49_016691 [Dermacentor silvarum]